MSDESYSSSPTIDYNYESYNSPSETVSPCSNSGMVDFGSWFLIVLYSLVFIIGFIGNGLVVCVLVKNRKQAVLTDLWLFNLALSDLLFVLTLPLYSRYVTVGQWTLGAFMCRFSAGVVSTGYFSSTFFMVVMALDRYLLIMHSRRATPYRSMRAGLVLSAVVWALSFGVSIPFFVLTDVTGEPEDLDCRYNPNGDDCWRRYEFFSITVLGLAIPLPVMVFCYSRIIPALTKMRSTKKHRVVKLIVAIMVVFFLLWGPYNISLLLEFLHSEGKIEAGCNFDNNLRISILVTETLGYTHCCLNPIIYAFMGQKFTRRALQLLKICELPVHRLFSRDSESSFRRSSLMSRSSEATFVM